MFNIIKGFLKRVYLRKFFFLLIYALSFYKITRRSSKQKVLFLFYHNLTNGKGVETGVLCPAVKSTVFTRQMEHLKRHYNVISIDECIEALREKRRLDPYSVVITFDDGYVNQYRYAFPILKKKCLNATFFITTSFIGTDNLFWWNEFEYMLVYCKKREITVLLDGRKILFRLNGREERECLCRKLGNEIFKNVNLKRCDNLMQLFRDATGVNVYSNKEFIENYRCMDKSMVKEMMDAGMCFGSHAVHHAILSSESREAQETEIKGSIGCLDTLRPLHFCYPGGSFNADTKLILESCGFQSALTVKSGFVNEGDDLYELKRISADQDFLEFVYCISGVDFFLTKVFQRIMDKCKYFILKARL